MLSKHKPKTSIIPISGPELDGAQALREITSEVSALSVRAIAAYTTRRILNSIKNAKMNTEEFEILACNLSSAMYSMNGEFRREKEHAEGIPSALKESVNTLVSDLDEIEATCREILSQGWIKRNLNLKTNKKNWTAIRAMGRKLMERYIFAQKIITFSGAGPYRIHADRQQGVDILIAPDVPIVYYDHDVKYVDGVRSNDGPEIVAEECRRIIERTRTTE